MTQRDQSDIPELAIRGSARLNVVIGVIGQGRTQAAIWSPTGEMLGSGTGLSPADAVLNAAAIWAGLRVLPRVELADDA